MQERIKTWGQYRRGQQNEDLGAAVRRLLGFADQMAGPDIALPFNFPDYLELVDWSGRAIVHGKRGAIPGDLPPILNRLGIQPNGFVRYIRKQENGFHHVIGTVEILKSLAVRFRRRFFKGQTAAVGLFSPTAEPQPFPQSRRRKRRPV